MKTNCPRGGHLNPAVAVRLYVRPVHVRLYCIYPPCLFMLLVFFFLCTSFVHLVDILSSPTCPSCFPGLAQTVWLMDNLLFGSLTSGWAGQLVLSLSISVSPWQNISVPLAPVCSTLMQSTQAPPWLHPLGPALSSFHCSSWSLKATSFGWEEGPFLASYASLCLLNLRASIDFRWERKNSQRETFNTQTAPHLHLLLSYVLHHRVVLEGREWTERTRSHRQRVHTWLSVAVGSD